MTWFIGQSLSMLILAFALGLFVGYLFWGRRFELLDTAVRTSSTVIDLRNTTSADTQEVAPATAKASAPKKSSAAKKPANRGANQTGTKTDDLTMIEGVGPKIVSALSAAGLNSFAAVAEADDKTLRAALTAAKVRITPSLGSWSAQARLLADGDLEGHQSLKEALVAGREVN